jgi:hypothetical protein
MEQTVEFLLKGLMERMAVRRGMWVGEQPSLGSEGREVGRNPN